MASTTSSYASETITTEITHASNTHFLWKAPPLTYEDFEGCGMRFYPSDVQLIDEFEDLWVQYLQDSPHVLQTGKNGKRIESLEARLLDLKVSKQNVHAELQRQLDFLEKSQEQMEAIFEKTKMQSFQEQKTKVKELEETLQSVGTTTRNLEASSDWELFFEGLEQAVEQSDVKTLSGDGLSTVLGLNSKSPRGGGNKKSASQIMKPSAKAMYLNSAAIESDINIKSRDFLVRAYRIDNTLLKAQVKTLQRDVERFEKGNEILDLVGKFLTEHNIWGVLSTSGTATRSGTTTVAGGTGD